MGNSSSLLDVPTGQLAGSSTLSPKDPRKTAVRHQRKRKTAAGMTKTKSAPSLPTTRPGPAIAASLSASDCLHSSRENMQPRSRTACQRNEGANSFRTSCSHFSSSSLSIRSTSPNTSFTDLSSFLPSPSNASLTTSLSDETGSGAVFIPHSNKAPSVRPDFGGSSTTEHPSNDCVRGQVIGMPRDCPASIPPPCPTSKTSSAVTPSLASPSENSRPKMQKSAIASRSNPGDAYLPPRAPSSLASHAAGQPSAAVAPTDPQAGPAKRNASSATGHQQSQKGGQQSTKFFGWHSKTSSSHASSSSKSETPTADQGQPARLGHKKSVSSPAFPMAQDGKGAGKVATSKSSTDMAALDPQQQQQQQQQQQRKLFGIFKIGASKKPKQQQQQQKKQLSSTEISVVPDSCKHVASGNRALRMMASDMHPQPLTYSSGSETSDESSAADLTAQSASRTNSISSWEKLPESQIIDASMYKSAQSTASTVGRHEGSKRLYLSPNDTQKSRWWNTLSSSYRKARALQDGNSSISDLTWKQSLKSSSKSSKKPPIPAEFRSSSTESSASSSAMSSAAPSSSENTSTSGTSSTSSKHGSEVSTKDRHLLLHAVSESLSKFTIEDPEHHMPVILETALVEDQSELPSASTLRRIMHVQRPAQSLPKQRIERLSKVNIQTAPKSVTGEVAAAHSWQPVKPEEDAAKDGLVGPSGLRRDDNLLQVPSLTYPLPRSMSTVAEDAVSVPTPASSLSLKQSRRKGVAVTPDRVPNTAECRTPEEAAILFSQCFESVKSDTIVHEASQEVSGPAASSSLMQSVLRKQAMKAAAAAAGASSSAATAAPVSQSLASGSPAAIPDTRVFVSDFDILSLVGAGSFGQVSVVKSKKTALPYALKVVRKDKLIEQGQAEHALEEQEIMASIDCPFIVTLYATFQDKRCLYFLMEYLNGGEIFTHLREELRFGAKTALFYVAEVVSALDYLHKNDIAYRDLKPENILLESSGHIKLIDFGFAKRLKPKEKTWSLCGTPEYLAPEIILNKGHGREVDCWALGVLIYEFVVGHPPFFGDDNVEMYHNIITGEYSFPECLGIPKAIRSLVDQLLDVRVSRRASIAQVKAHAWFASLDWEVVARRGLAPPMLPDVDGSIDTSMYDGFEDAHDVMEWEVWRQRMLKETSLEQKKLSMASATTTESPGSDMISWDSVEVDLVREDGIYRSASGPLSTLHEMHEGDTGAAAATQEMCRVELRKFFGQFNFVSSRYTEELRMSEELRSGGHHSGVKKGARLGSVKRRD